MRGRPRNSRERRDVHTDHMGRYESSRMVMEQTGDVVLCCRAFYTDDERSNLFVRDSQVYEAHYVFVPLKKGYFV